MPVISLDPRIEQTERAYDYAKFPREFVTYRWFKPLLVALLSLVFYIVFEIVLVVAVLMWTGDLGFFDSFATGYDDMDAYSGPGALFELGSIAAMLPALALAMLIVQDRPFSSYSSSRGGWNWSAFLKCLLVAVVIMAIDFAVEYALFPTMPGDGVVQFTAIGLALCIVLVPFQCVAEEYIFRGFLLQTFGAWTKLPVIAIVVSAALFAAGHPYNLVGVIGIFCSGLIWGFVAWRTRGLEASSALHIVNNMVAFLASGFGLGATTSEVTAESLAIMLAIDAAYAVAVLLLGKKFDWFSSKGDGTAKFNEKKRAQMARKQQRREQQCPEPPVPR